jgi:hypothetical protein
VSQSDFGRYGLLSDIRCQVVPPLRYLKNSDMLDALLASPG